MKKITKFLTLAGMLITASLQGQVFFSEYAEGTSNNKYLEIYNGSGKDVNLEDYLLVSCSNGCKNDGIKGVWQMTFLGVGPSQGNTSWYSTSVDNSTRPCLHDDYVVFYNDGVFKNEMGDETFLEAWQHSGTTDICGTPAAPFDGSKLGTWKDNGDGTFTVYGQGSHVGIPKVHNGGETADGTAKDSITYEYTITNDSSMVVEIEINNGAYWTFHYVKVMNTFEYDNSGLFSGKTVKSGDVFVITHGSAQDDIKAKGDTTLNFLSNGNDWYALWKKSDRSFVDEIGENTDEDNDPSDGWDVAGVTAATKDYTLIRKSYVREGSKWINSAGTSAANSEWIVADKPTADYVSNDLGVFNTPVGAWSMIYLGVGGSKGDGSWYNSTSDPTATDVILNANGVFQNFRGDCVKPDNGTWIDNKDGSFTVIGKANFVGIHKVFNGGETSDGSPANADTITYFYEVYGGDTLQVDIEILTGDGKEGWWRFIYERRSMPTAKRLVKFAVDMSNETVSSAGLHVAGSFQNWNPGSTPLTDAGNGIYEVHACVDANTLIEYKYINNNSWDDATLIEKVPAISQKGHSNNGEVNDNRWFYSGSGNDTLMLPAFVFGGSAPSGQYAVRFAVDMKNETVSSDGVHIAGNIQGWDPSKDMMMNLYSSNSIYETIFCLADGNYEYKFVNGNAWGSDESVPSSCATNNNRGVSVSGADVAEKLVCFGSCDACPGAAIPKMKVTLEVDMASECDVDDVDLAGGKINGWSGGTKLAGTSGLAGDWKLVFLGVGENKGQNNWFKSTIDDLSINTDDSLRWSSMSDDRVVLNRDGSFYNLFGESTWLETWQGGSNMPGNPVAPHDGKMAGRWSDNGDGTFTVYGRGSHLGLPKVINGAEIKDPANAADSITYEFELNGNSHDSMLSVYVNFGPGIWQFNYIRANEKPSVWSVTVELDSGVEIAHKFRKITNVDGVDLISWESDGPVNGNYAFTAHSDTTLKARCFGKEEACSGTPIAPANITFTVDLSQEIANDTVWLMGSFTVPQWQAGAIALTQDASNSDLYSVTVENVCADKMSYKFANEAMNSSTNGETFPDSTDRSCVVDNGQGGWNRTLTRTDDQDITVAYIYNTCQPASSANTTDLSTEMSIAPNPANGIFTVKLAGSKINTVEILSIDGRTIRSYNANSISTSIDATGLNGIFLVKVSDNIGRTAIKKIVLQ